MVSVGDDDGEWDVLVDCRLREEQAVAVGRLEK
jgi:hypothetical protein